MSRLQKLIVTLIIIALLPATTLAGSMRFCVGQDGHRKVEFAHGGHHAEPAAHVEHAAPCGSQAKSVDKKSCSDFTLLSASTSALQSGLSKKQVQADDHPPLQPCLPATAREIVVGFSSAIRDLSAICPRHDDPRLTSIRTTVLLI